MAVHVMCILRPSMQKCILARHCGAPLLLSPLPQRSLYLHTHTRWRVQVFPINRHACRCSPLPVANCTQSIVYPSLPNVDEKNDRTVSESARGARWRGSLAPKLPRAHSKETIDLRTMRDGCE